MAKKKNLAAEVAKIEPTPPRSVGQFQLALPVSDRVEIEGLLIEDCSYSRTPEANAAHPKFTGEGSHEVKSIARSKDNAGFNVSLGFAFAGKIGAEKEPSVVIRCSFVVVYSCKELDKLTDENLAAFASTNAVFNVYPYWREFVQDASLRMSLSPIVLNVFRLR